MQKIPIESKVSVTITQGQQSKWVYAIPTNSLSVKEPKYINCYSCEAIRQQMENNLPVVPFALNGFEYVKTVEKLNYKEYAPEKISFLLKMGFQELSESCWCRECGSAIHAKLYMKEYTDKIELSFSYKQGENQVDKVVFKLPAQTRLLSPSSLSSIGDLCIYENLKLVDTITLTPYSFSSYHLIKNQITIGTVSLNPSMNEITLSVNKTGEIYAKNLTYSLFIYKGWFEKLNTIDLYDVIQAGIFNSNSQGDTLIDKYVGYVKLNTYNPQHNIEDDWDINWPIVTTPEEPGEGGEDETGIRNVLAWGSNSFGQLGDGTIIDKRIPVLNLLTDSTKIAPGKYHTISIDKSKSVWVWGRNDNGQLGLNFKDNSYHSFPSKLEDIGNIIDVSSGWFHSVALEGDGTVWTWGGNYKGQLGDGTNAEKHRPIQVKTTSTTFLSNIKAISAGSEFTIALDNSGRVWRWGEDQLFPKIVENLTNIIAINAGSWHSLALKSDGTVWAFGYNWSGQLGIGFNEYPNSVDEKNQYIKGVPVQGLANVIAIDAGAEHSMALKSDGTLWVWGDDVKGQLGLGTTNRSKYYPVQNSSLSNVKFICTGEYHNLVVLNDKTIWSWGDNTYGQLGINNLESQSFPVQITHLPESTFIYGGLTHSFAIKKIEGNN